MQRICNTLSSAGWHCTLIGFRKKHSVILEQKQYAQERISVLWKKGKLFYIEYNCRLFLRLLFRRYDMYCGVDLDTLLPVFCVAYLHRKPCIYDAHEYFTGLPEITGRPFIRRIWQRLEKFLLPKIRHNYTVSASIASVLSEKYRQPYAVIRNLPLLDADTELPEKGSFILYQGALNAGRGIEALLHAMRDVPADLYLAGEGDLSAEFRSMASTLPYADRIHFLGYLHPGELRTYTRRAYIGVNCITPDSLNYYYSLANKFFDYIHAGTPQVTMRFPEYENINAQFEVALLISNLEPAHIADSLNRLLTDHILYARLRENTLIARQTLNWQREEQKLIEFYRKIG